MPSRKQTNNKLKTNKYKLNTLTSTSILVFFKWERSSNISASLAIEHKNVTSLCQHTPFMLSSLTSEKHSLKMNDLVLDTLYNTFIINLKLSICNEIISCIALNLGHANVWLLKFTFSSYCLDRMCSLCPKELGWSKYWAL